MFLVETPCRFEPIANNECPADPDLKECTSHMMNGEFCEADQRLPDGNTNFDINNCGNYDVFKCIIGIYTVYGIMINFVVLNGNVTCTLYQKQYIFLSYCKL